MGGFQSPKLAACKVGAFCSSALPKTRMGCCSSPGEITRTHRPERTRLLVCRGVVVLPSLFAIRGNDQGHCFELYDQITTLGREAGNTIQLHDTEVSRRHAEVRLNGSSCVLTDLESSNGTFVNGKRVESHQLRSGDHVQFGRTLLLFTGATEEDTEHSRVKVVLHEPEGSSLESSQIVSSIGQEESSRIFDTRTASTEAPFLARASRNLQVMYRMSLAVSHTLDIDELLGRILELIFDWVEADRGCILLYDADTKRHTPRAQRSRKGLATDQTMNISQTILDYVLEHNEGVVTSDAKDDRRWNPAASILQMGIREAICVPMQGRYGNVGAIYIDTATSAKKIIQQGAHNQFSEEHLKLMIVIAQQAALAVEDTQYYSAMVQAERLAAVGQTIATLSHHIKNVLQGVRGGSYLIEQGLENHDQGVIRKGWNIVDRNQNKISTLVMDMLTFSKNRDPELEPSEINKVVGEVIDLISLHASGLDVDLTWTPATDIPTLTFDPEGLHRAVLNLVTNAIDAAGENHEVRGNVRVSTSYDKEQGVLRVRVEDNGGGIASEDREAIFNLFVSRKGGRGTGLGLPVCQKIVHEHGGRILVESELNEGSCFTIELPTVDASR